MNAPRALVFTASSLLDPQGFAHDGVREMLAALRAAGYPVALADPDARPPAELGPFDAAPPPGVPPGDTAVIAGTPAELDGARAAGAATAAALWADADCDAGAEPTWRFARPAEVTRAFARWC